MSRTIITDYGRPRTTPHDDRCRNVVFGNPLEVAVYDFWGVVEERLLHFPPDETEFMCDRGLFIYVFDFS